MRTSHLLREVLWPTRIEKHAQVISNHLISSNDALSGIFPTRERCLRFLVRLLMNTLKNNCCHFYFCTESNLDDLRSDIQSPEPELLYYRASEGQESSEHPAEGNAEEMAALSWDASGAQNWYKMLINMPYSAQNSSCTCDIQSWWTLLCHHSLPVSLPRPHANYPVPVTVVYAPPAPAVAVSQDFSYHNTDSAEVRTASPHCPLSNQPSAAEGEKPSS